MYRVSCKGFFLASSYKVRFVSTRSSEAELALQDTEGEAVFGTSRDLHFATAAPRVGTYVYVRGSCKVRGTGIFSLCKTLIRQKNDALQLKTCSKTFAVCS
jgi:hypothetical protein